jgi:drug/metabolite transporter (DMT)-like permease
MQKIWYGIFWKVVSCGCFAGINVLVRFLSGGTGPGSVAALPIYVIMFYQNALGALLLGCWVWRRRGDLSSTNFSKQHVLLHTLRIIAAVSGIGFWYLSLRYIPITQVVALSFVAPILTTVSAVIFLHESFDWRRKLAVVFSLVGGFLITRPDRALFSVTNFDFHICLPILAAFIFSFDKIFTRRLLKLNTSTIILAWYLLLFTTILCLVPMLFYGWISPSLPQVWYLVGLGVLGVFAHYTFNKAYALAEVTVLLPFGVAKLLISAGISYLVFSEIPRSMDIWLGVLIMLVSTLLLSMKPIRLRDFFSKQVQTV